MNAEEPTYKDFAKQAKALAKWANIIDGLTRSDWEALTIEEREEFYRMVAADARWVRIIAERFFEW